MSFISSFTNQQRTILFWTIIYSAILNMVKFNTKILWVLTEILFANNREIFRSYKLQCNIVIIIIIVQQFTKHNTSLSQNIQYFRFCEKVKVNEPGIMWNNMSRSTSTHDYCRIMNPYSLRFLVDLLIVKFNK